MSTAEVTKPLTEKTSRASSFIAAYYLLTILTGAFVLSFHGRLAFAADVFVGLFYLVVTAFLYGMSAARDKSSSARE